MSIDSNLFNTNKTDYEATSLFLQPSGNGLFDTVNKSHPEIWKLYKTMKSLDWDENEFNYETCANDFATCSKSTYDMMIKTLAWQWEADSVASRIAPLVGCFVTSSELWAAWQRISDNEVVHSATYSEIVRNSFSDPSVIFSEILAVEQSVSRLSTVAETMSKIYTTAHEYALGKLSPTQDVYNTVFLFPVTMLILERIQFMSSFAVTFAICDTGAFQPIGKAVQKIAQDEFEVHVELDKAVITAELKTERGQIAFRAMRETIKKLVDEVVKSEMEWVDYLFSEGRELVGLNADVLKQWTLFNAKDVYEFLDIETEYKLPKQNPLRFMEDWLNINKTQASPQEEDAAAYKVNVIKRDDEGQVFDMEF